MAYHRRPVRHLPGRPASLQEEQSCRSVAQSGSALAWGARGPEFKSRRSDQINQTLSPTEKSSQIAGVQFGVQFCCVIKQERRWALVRSRRLREALSLIDVRVLDHLIVAECVYSFAEHGLL